jgi:tRNA(Ile)-lysidine synthetase-like protein
VGGGAFAARTRADVEWRRSPAEPLVESPLAVPGVLTLSGGNRLVTRWGNPADDGLRGPTVGLLDAERVVGGLFVRPRRAGDRVRRPGGMGSKTLADCWSEAGVAADRREALPVVCDEGGVVWAPWAGPDERVSGLSQGGGRLVLDYQEIRYTDR